MIVRSLAAFALGAALVVPVPSALAGVVMGDLQRMDTGAGLLDLDHPVSDPFTDLASIEDPGVGSYLLVEASVPDLSAFSSELEFTSISGPDAVFSFSNGGYLAPWHLGEYEFGFVASRLAFTSSLGVIVTLTGSLETTGTGYGFFDVGGDIQDLVTFGRSTVSYSTTLGAGLQTIAWGSLIGNAGGFAGFTGTVTLTLVPGPGSLALCLAAGAVTRRRRRA